MNPKERQISSIEGGVAVAEPIEIFSQVKKTPRMIEVERVIQDDLPKFLERKYFVERLSQDDISQVIREISEGHIQIRGAAIGHWLKRFNILVRSRSEGIKLAWQNPEKREYQIERILKGIHSSAVSRKRSKALSRYWENLSEAERENRLRPVRETRRAAMLNHMREKLGEDPTERLREMCGRLSPSEIAGELEVSPSTVRTWKENLGIETRKPRKSTQGIGFIRANEESKQELIKKARARGLVEMLEGKEQYVIYARFPSEGGRIKSHIEIGKSLYPDRPKIYRQWPQAIEKRALRKLEAMVETA